MRPLLFLALFTLGCTVTVTATPEPTSTLDPTATPEPTAIPAPTATPNLEATIEASIKATIVAEPTSTLDPTATPEPTAIPAPTATPNLEATIEASIEATIAAEPPPTLTLEPSPTPDISGLGFSREQLESKFAPFGYTFEQRELNDGRLVSDGESLIEGKKGYLEILGPSENVSSVTLWFGWDYPVNTLGIALHLLAFYAVLFPEELEGSEEVSDWVTSTLRRLNGDGEDSQQFDDKKVTVSDNRDVLKLILIRVESVEP